MGLFLWYNNQIYVNNNIMKTVINRVIKTLIGSNFFLNSGWGLLAPIFTVFIVKNITNGDFGRGVAVSGLTALIFWITKSLLQVPIARYLDKNRGEYDDFWAVVIGTLITAFVPLGFILSTTAWHIYALQILYAVGSALNFPSWSAIFTRHIDRGQEALEWSINSTFLGVGFGIANGVGGVAVAVLGFNLVFVLVSAFLFISTILLLFIKKDVAEYHRKRRALRH